MSTHLNPRELQRLLHPFLKEDLGTGDLTTQSIVPTRLRGRGKFIARHGCVLAGIDAMAFVFRLLDPHVQWKWFFRDGQKVPPGKTIAQVEGSARALLSGERVALNILQHLSGIATLTHQYVRATRGTRTWILDTRKTIPGWRRLEKYAVRCGGGHNHRVGLYDAILIKDNHIAVAGSVSEAIRRARKHATPGIPLEVEVASSAQLREALTERVDQILLDNMTPRQVRQSVEQIRRHPGGKKVIVECSGNISLRTVRQYAGTGVDWISVGALTHSAPAVDISFELGMKKTDKPRQ